MNWASAIWEWIPNGLKKFVGMGLASGLAFSCVLFIWLLWGSGYIHEKLNIPTATQRQAENEALERERASEQQRAIALTAERVVTMAMDSARQSQDSLFNAIVKEVIEPGIERQNRLFEQVRELNRRMGINNDKLDAQVSSTETAARSMEELRVLMRQGLAETELDDLLRLMQKIDADQERIKSKLKIKTKEF
jgi:hypothetical protein